MTRFRGHCLAAFAAAVAFGPADAARAQEALPEPLPEPAPMLETAIAPIESLAVALDLATIMRVPNEASTLVIGNPAIADATIQRNGLIVVTGKSYGTTNLLALNRDGVKLREFMIHVSAPKERTLTVLRGGARETWSCSPHCEQTVTLGDAPDYFGASSGQIGSRNGLASQR
jgi:Flp pilus assembly secretin CpaC